MVGMSRPIEIIDETPLVINGEPTPNSVLLLKTWASIKESRGNQQILNGQTALTKFFEFRVRYRQISLNAATRIVCDGKKYTVHSIEKENQRSFYMIITAEAK